MRLYNSVSKVDILSLFCRVFTYRRLRTVTQLQEERWTAEYLLRPDTQNQTSDPLVILAPISNTFFHFFLAGINRERCLHIVSIFTRKAAEPHTQDMKGKHVSVRINGLKYNWLLLTPPRQPPPPPTHTPHSILPHFLPPNHPSPAETPTLHTR